MDNAEGMVRLCSPRVNRIQPVETECQTLIFNYKLMSQSDPSSNRGLAAKFLQANVKRRCVRQVGLLSTALVDS